MLYEIRGLGIDYPQGAKRIKMLVRNTTNGLYQRFIFPDDKPFNHGQIIKFLGDQLGVSPGEIIWPSHIQVPKVKIYP